MDTVIKLIIKNKSVFLASDHAGYDKETYLLVRTILKVVNKDKLDYDDTSILNDKLYRIDFYNGEDIEIVINDNDKTIYLDNLLDVCEIKGIEFCDLKKVDFKNESLLFKNEMTYQEFLILYNFISPLFNEDEVIINNKYLLRIHKRIY